MRTVQRIRKSVTPLLIAAPMWLCGYTFTKDAGSKQQACLELSGEVVKTESTASRASQILLIEENKVIDSLQIPTGQTFRFSLEKNKYYSVRVYQEGFVPRLVSVSTYMPTDLRDERSFKFHFDLVQMSNEGNAEELNDALDFPVAVISFDETKGYFDYNHVYTAHIKNLYSKLQSSSSHYLTTKL
jgi:hypothetical protein